MIFFINKYQSKLASKCTTGVLNAVFVLRCSVADPFNFDTDSDPALDPTSIEKILT